MYISKGYAKVEYKGVVGYMKAKYLLYKEETKYKRGLK